MLRQAGLLAVVALLAGPRADGAGASLGSTLRGEVRGAVAGLGDCPAKCLQLHPPVPYSYWDDDQARVVTKTTQITDCERACERDCTARYDACPVIQDQWDNWVRDRACATPIAQECKPRCTAQLLLVRAFCAENFVVTRMASTKSPTPEPTVPPTVPPTPQPTSAPTSAPSQATTPPTPKRTWRKIPIPVVDVGPDGPVRAASEMST
jgi:hypothetical protein